MYNTITKTIAAWAFNHYIAYYYFDNVNVSQLRVAFEKGEVELENLPIKKDALQHFNLPLEVVSGIVGRLSIKVPLLTLLSDPWAIKIENLMLIVAPKKEPSNMNGNTSTTSSNLGDQSQLIQEASDANLTEYFENSHTESDDIDEISSEETKLAEFYSSFSSTVSSMVRDIYKNIKLEIQSMTILFENPDHGLVKLNLDSLLLHRPKAARNLVMCNLSTYLSNIGIASLNGSGDLLSVCFDKCSLDIHDESSNNLQLAIVQLNDSNPTMSAINQPPATSSETKIEGNLENVSIELLTHSCKKYDIKKNEPIKDSRPQSGRVVAKCDEVKIEFKMNDNIDNDVTEFLEKNLHIKLDLVGLQYIHSQRIYEITTRRLTNLLKFFVRLRQHRARKTGEKPSDKIVDDESQTEDPIKTKEKTSFNKLLNINIEKGLLYVVDDTSGSCAIPLIELSLNDCRVFQFSGRHQQNGFIFAKIGCCYYNREVSNWDTFLQPWPFNLTWDLKVADRTRRIRHRKISINSDEVARFFLTTALLDLSDLALKRIVNDFIFPKLRPLSPHMGVSGRSLAQDFNSLFVLHNETGFELHFAPLEENNDRLDVQDSSCSSPTIGPGGDMVGQSLMHKISLRSRSSLGSRDSPDFNSTLKWTSVGVGETISFEYEMHPIYRRHIDDSNAQSRMLLVRIDGWKTLMPIAIDRTGQFFREACSDRVMNEDTYIVISIELEERSARKIICIRSPLLLVNQLDSTLELHFVESNHALYVKPNGQLSVPLPYLFNQMHIRPCNVGVTMSEQALLWDKTQLILDHESKIHICHPISVTNLKHASYCTSHPYRICVATNRCWPRHEETPSLVYAPLPVFSMNFIPPLTLVNLLPCKIQYFIGETEGTLEAGAQHSIYHVDTTKPAEVSFKMNGFPQSKALNIDPGATGSFQQTLEIFDKRNRSLYLHARVILSSAGEEPSVQVMVYSPFWFINKTRLPLIFKQEGAALEAAGQHREHEDTAVPILLFSFYDSELEPPWLCSMRLGKSKGLSMWCEGFKLEKGAGERKLCFIPNGEDNSSRMDKSLININIRRGFGRYSETMVVTFTTRYGYDPSLKTPKKALEASPQNYKLTSYNHNVNLAERMASQAVSLFNNHYHKTFADFDLNVPGLTLTLIDNWREKLLEASVDDIAVKCSTNAKEQILDCSIHDIRIENGLPDSEKDIVLARAAVIDEKVDTKPALRLIMDRILGNSFGTTLFRQVQLSMCELVVNIEEKLVLKLVEFISFRKCGQTKNIDNLSRDLERILHPEDDRMTQYYFDLLRIDLSSLKLSVFSSPNLTSSLLKLKSYLGLNFFGFEDAQVHLSPYFKMNVSRTFRGVFDSVTRFYRRQILEQAPRIVGQQIQNYLKFHLSDLLSTLYDEVYNKLFN